MLAVPQSDKKRCALLDVRSSSARWQPIASRESERCFHAVAAVGEHSVVMLGGWETDFEERTDTVQLYDARADRWSERAEWRLPAPSSSHCAVLID